MSSQQRQSRFSDKQLEKLLTSIKRQSNKLKRHTSNSRNAQPRTRVNSPFIPGGQSSPTIERREFNYSQTLIENLVIDNRLLNNDIEDFTQAIHLIVQKYRELKRDLEAEQFKTSSVELLEEQLTVVRNNNQSLAQVNMRLKEQYLGMMEMLRQTVFELADEDKNEVYLQEQLMKENKHLKDILGISKLSDTCVKQIDEELASQERELCQDPNYRANLQEYLNKRNKPPPPPAQKKGFLLGKPPKQQNIPSFFAKHEKK